MLEVLLDSALDGIDKNLKFAQTLTKKTFKSLSADENVSLVLYFTIVLLPAEQGGIFQENDRKWNSIWACGTGSSKVIFTLLEEIVTLQVSFTLINIQEPSFQRPLTCVFIVRSCDNDGSRKRCRSRKRKRSSLKNGLDDPLKVIHWLPNHRGVGGAKNNTRSDNKCNNGSRSMCHGESRSVTVAILGGGSASKLVFAVVRILARTLMSRGLSHWAGWVEALIKSSGI